MALDLVEFEEKVRRAVQEFWRGRESARQRQSVPGKLDQGERAGVTGGKNMDGFIALAQELVQANGLGAAEIHQRRAMLTLPGYFRPTKLWDMLVMREGELIAAIEFKSQAGPSFGNNFNNRCEEAIGTAHDFWTAFREGAFGRQSRPFLGWLMLVEDAGGSRAPVRDASPHFEVFKEFQGASYLRRYDVLCQRLEQEQLYSSAVAIASPRSAARDGSYTNVNPSTGLRSFVSSLEGHAAMAAARRKDSGKRAG